MLNVDTLLTTEGGQSDSTLTPTALGGIQRGISDPLAFNIDGAKLFEDPDQNSFSISHNTDSDSEDGYSSMTESVKNKGGRPNKRKKVVDSSKSRESAKENRKKQRLRVEALVTRVKALTEENEGLKAHILNVTQRKAEVQKHRMDMERMMARKVLEKSYRDEPENQEELHRLVQNFRDLYADYGAYRHKEVGENSWKTMIATIISFISL